MFRFKKGLSLLLLVPVFLLSTVTLSAQVTLEGEFRPRSEYRNGYRLLQTTGTEPAFFTSQRTRIKLGYETPNYRIRVSGQDVRVWGEVNQLQDNANVNIHEAWALLKLSEAVNLKLGRQELIYDNHRLLGNVNWTQQARSHDALLLQYQNSISSFRLDLGGAYNQQSENIFGNTYNLDNYKFLSYLWANKTFGPVNVSAIILSDGFEQPGDNMSFRYTYGTYLVYKKEDELELSGSIYLQRGDDRVRRDISAHMFALKASYTLTPFQVVAGYDYLSGGNATDANPARHTFNTLYATNHKFYGHMDYFLNIPADTRGGGLQDLYAGASYKVADHSTVKLRYHYFALANEIRDPQNPSETTDRYLGSEFDLSFTHEFTDDITLRLGYSTLINSSSLDRLQDRNARESQHWGWAMLVLAPEFFQQN